MKTSNGWNAEDAWDEVKLRTWTDANTAILYASCYGRSRDLKAAFVFTLKFDDAGDWKIIETHQVTTKEARRRTMRSSFTFKCAGNPNETRKPWFKEQ